MPQISSNLCFSIPLVTTHYLYSPMTSYSLLKLHCSGHAHRLFAYAYPPCLQTSSFICVFSLRAYDSNQAPIVFKLVITTWQSSICMHVTHATKRRNEIASAAELQVQCVTLNSWWMIVARKNCQLLCHASCLCQAVISAKRQNGDHSWCVDMTEHVLVSAVRHLVWETVKETVWITPSCPFARFWPSNPESLLPCLSLHPLSPISP